MEKRSISQINEKIRKNEAVVLTAEEISLLINEGEEPKFQDVDVITTGTCGLMSGTVAVFNLSLAEPGAFQKAHKIFLNGIPGFPGPCPNEWLGKVDLMVYGTSHSLNDPEYGGGFLFKDLLKGEEVKVELESIEGKSIETYVTLDDFETHRIIGTRMAFCNYTAFINPTQAPISSIFNAVDMEGPFKSISFSGCGELNPIQNDPQLHTICPGTKILLNGAEGLVMGEGTRSTPAKPNLMLTADMKEMNHHYLGGFKTGAGPEIFNTLALPIPVLNEKILKNTFIGNKDIELPIADIRGRHSILGYTDYACAWEESDERPQYVEDDCRRCRVCIVEERCPTLAYLHGTFYPKKCFGCGMCAFSCPYDAFHMNTGQIPFKINDEEISVPVSCRQSDLKRARELTRELKKKIEEGNFFFNKCRSSD